MRNAILLALYLVLATPFQAMADGRCMEPLWTSTHSLAQNSRALHFQKALRFHKTTLRALYPDVSSNEYESLSRLAFAIMGAESKYYQSWWYFLKSWTPASAVKVAKCVRRGQCGDKHLLSSGPTQIKEIPARAQIEFKITPASLFSHPDHAAIATMAFLIELRDYLYELQDDRYPHALEHLSAANLNDHLVYFYQGKGRRILNGEKPDPKKNSYLAVVQQHLSAIRDQSRVCPEIQIARPNPAIAPALEGSVVGAMQ